MEKAAPLYNLTYNHENLQVTRGVTHCTNVDFQLYSTVGVSSIQLRSLENYNSFCYKIRRLGTNFCKLTRMGIKENVLHLVRRNLIFHRLNCQQLFRKGAGTLLSSFLWAVDWTRDSRGNQA